MRILRRLSGPTASSFSSIAEAVAMVLPVAIFATVVTLYVGGAPYAPAGAAPAPSSSSAEATDAPEPSVAPGPDSTTDPTENPASDPQSLLADLASLPTAGSQAGDYVRDAFGPGWLDPDRNGCDARNDILARDLDGVEFRPGTNQCVVVRGVLDDPYTGAVIDFVKGQGTSELVQIDHVVPLALAWRSGAWRWDQPTRETFANDPLNLLAVDGEANQVKSDSGPSAWVPDNRSYRCQYAERFTAVLVKYQLAVDGADRSTLGGMLQQCL